MAGILSGLEQFGFSNLEEVKVFEQQKKEESKKIAEQQAEEKRKADEGTAACTECCRTKMLLH